MQVRNRLPEKSDAKVTTTAGLITVDPVFFTHSVKTPVGFLEVVDKEGTLLGNYLLQLDGRNGRLTLVEKKARSEAPYYSGGNDDQEDADE